MKNFFLIGFILLASLQNIEAREALLPDPSVVIDTGSIEEPALLASAGGEAFIEFSNATKFVLENGFLSFTGEILSPVVIALPDQRPKLRMNPLLSFELGTDSGEPILFVDRFDLQNARNRIREKYLNPDAMSRSSWVKLIIPIEDNAVGRPRLWEYIGPDEGWATIGGVLDDSNPESDVRVFSAILHRTGTYTLFDEDPAPKFHDSTEDIIASSININDEEFWNESNGELPEGVTWEEIQSIALDGGNSLHEEENNFEDLPEAQIVVNNREITIDEAVALNARKLQLISQITHTEDPQEAALLHELLALINRKLEIVALRKNLINRKKQMEVLMESATSEEGRSTASQQWAIIEAQLKSLEDVVLENRIRKIEDSLPSEEIVTTETPSIVVPEPEIEIPKEGKLPQTGTETLNENQSPSLVFPIALLFVLLFVITSAVIASHKKH